MGSLLFGDKVLDNELVVAYEIRSSRETAPLTALAVGSKSDPMRSWKAFGAPKAIAGIIYVKAYRRFLATGEWPRRVGHQS